MMKWKSHCQEIKLISASVQTKSKLRAKMLSGMLSGFWSYTNENHDLKKKKKKYLLVLHFWRTFVAGNKFKESKFRFSSFLFFFKGRKMQNITGKKVDVSYYQFNVCSNSLQIHGLCFDSFIYFLRKVAYCGFNWDTIQKIFL